jgi:hypothetical protein
MYINIVANNRSEKNHELKNNTATGRPSNDVVPTHKSIRCLCACLLRNTPVPARSYYYKRKMAREEDARIIAT